MDKPTNPYCVFSYPLESENVHKKYHDTAYGFPIYTDDDLFGRLILEINQAGLSWTTILKKEKNFYDAYDQYSISKIAAYQQNDIDRLLQNSGIIRNRLKIVATIHNAQVILELQKEWGSFKNWLDSNHPKTKKEWTNIFKSTFKFTGGEIVNEFLMSTGYLAGAHSEACPIYAEVLKQNPKWNT